MSSIVEGCALVPPRQFIRISVGFKVDSKMEPKLGYGSLLGNLLGASWVPFGRSRGDCLGVSWRNFVHVLNMFILSSLRFFVGRVAA